MNDSEIRSVLVPVTNAALLLPNAAVAEVIALSELAPIADAPEWLLGTTIWHGWEVPVAAWAVLTRLAGSESTAHGRIAVFKALTGGGRMPYFGILTQGFPQLTSVNAANLVAIPDAEVTIGMLARAILQEREVIVPDLDRTAQLIAHAAYGALPITAG
mgnify:CR=1 FL=1